MKTDEEPASRSSSGAGKTRKKKSTVHVHIGPHARAYRRGLALCPICDAERICRMTDSEREQARAKKADRS